MKISMWVIIGVLFTIYWVGGKWMHMRRREQGDLVSTTESDRRELVFYHQNGAGAWALKRLLFPIYGAGLVILVLIALFT